MVLKALEALMVLMVLTAREYPLVAQQAKSLPRPQVLTMIPSGQIRQVEAEEAATPSHGLSDTPSTLGSAGQSVVVTSTGDAWYFATPSGGTASVPYFNSIATAAERFNITTQLQVGGIMYARDTHTFYILGYDSGEDEYFTNQSSNR